MAKAKSLTSTEEILDRLQGDLNSIFGDGSAMRLSAATQLSHIDHWVSSRSIVVDSVLRGGRPIGSSLVPFSRQMEISGPNDSGKTTLCAQIAAETQEKGGLVLVTDTEEKIAHDYWEGLGVNTKEILHIKATDLTDVFNKQYRAMQIAREAAADRNILMIWDSLGGTAGAEMMEMGSKEDPMEQASKFGMRRAKVISDGMELVNTIVSKTRVCYLFTNHEYMKYDVKFGSPRETRGGGKPKYFATVRLQLTPVGNIKEDDPNSKKDQVIGKRVRVRALKNHMSGLLLERDAVLMYKRGFVDAYTVFDVGRRLGLVKLKGSWGEWISPQGESIKFQGFHGFENKVVSHLEYAVLREAVEEEL